MMHSVRSVSWIPSSPSGYDKLREPRSLEAQPSLSGSRCGWRVSLLHWLAGWPALIICGQILLQSFAWGFFAAVEHRGFIALPVRLAANAKAHTHYVTLISTIISTGLAACSSFLFSAGFSRATSLQLRQPMSLGAFVSTVRISARSLVLDPRRWKLSVLSVGVLILTGVQTSGWSTLLTPADIVIESPVSGSELDLASPLLRQALSNGQLDFCIYNASLITAFSVAQTESGYALAKNKLGYPASFTLMDQTFNISTAGILPATPRDVYAAAWFPNMTVIPSTLEGLAFLPDGLSADYIVNQQGFTVDVSCSYQDLTADTNPSLNLLAGTVKDWNAPLDSVQMETITYSEMTSDCPIPENSGFNFTASYTRQDPSYIMMIACQSANNYTLIFSSAGLYGKPTTVCSLSPKITRLEVHYSASTGINATVVDEPTLDPNGPAVLSAVATLKTMMFYAQATSSNTVGDEIHSVLLDVPGSAWDKEMLALTEEYLRGAAESSGSVLRACLTGLGGTFPDGIPANMAIPITGTVFTQTVGWTRISATGVLILLPGTFVALATIIIVVGAVAQHAGEAPSDDFDPSDAMHLVAAAAAGGLGGAFTGASDEELEASERVDVVLRTIPGRGPGLFLTDDRARVI